jgi:hypothetical protein
MAEFQFDHDMSRLVGEGLRKRGYLVELAIDLGLADASDARHLLAATNAGRVLVTHNGQHFEALHDAWHRWSDSWGVPSAHGGILVVPHRPPAVLEDLLVAFLPTVPMFTGAFYRWRSNGGWRRQPYLP